MWQNKMRKIRRLSLVLPLILSLCLSSKVSASSELIPEGEIQTDRVIYKTETVAPRKIQTTISKGAEIYYPKTERVIYEGPEATYVGMACKGNQTEVKAGDPLIEINVKVDEVGIVEKQLALKRRQASFEKGKEDREKEIKDLEEQVQKAGTELEKQKLSIRAEIAKIRLEQYIFSEENTIKSQQEAIDEQAAQKEVHYICATTDGTVSQIPYFSAGDVIHTGQAVAVITKQDVCMFKSDSELAYGLDVVVHSNGREPQIMNGTIVASSSVLTSDKPFSLIAVTGETIPKSTGRTNWSFDVTTEDIQNILMVSRQAVEKDDKKEFVTLLDEANMPHKRFIKTVLTAVDGVWILDGLKEGDRVVIK